jgi:hypothetical protein
MSTAGKETVQDPKDTSVVVMTDKWGTTMYPPVTNNLAGNENEYEEPTTIVTTNKGDISALPALTSIFVGNIFQTGGQLLKSMAEAYLLFN